MWSEQQTALGSAQQPQPGVPTAGQQVAPPGRSAQMEIRVWLVHTGADAAIDARKNEASVDGAAAAGAQAAMASSTAKLTRCTVVVDDGMLRLVWISFVFNMV